MTKKASAIFFAVGALFTLILGTVGHFFYEWSGENKIAGIFFPVNESVWEHMKLTLLPTGIYLGAAAIKLRGGNYALSSFLALFIGAALIPLLFYSYTGIIGRSILAVDIAIFFFSVLAGFAVAFLAYNSAPRPILNELAVIGIIAIAVCFFTFTSFPPDFILFEEP